MSLVEKINNANALGRQNLGDKGVDVSADATTYEIMQSIADIIIGGGGSGGIEYASIIYNDDNTVTLTEKDGTEHTIVCTYNGDNLINVTYDGKAVKLTYENGNLVKVGGVTVDVSNAPASASGGGTEELEQLIDESGVLDTEGTVTEKVEQLIDKAEIEKCLYEASKNKTNMQDLFAYYTGKKLPRVDCSKVIQAQRFAEYSEIEEVDYCLNFSVCSQLMSAFQNTTNLKTMVGIDTSNATDVRNMFNKSGIEVIQEPFDFSKVSIASYTSAFTTAKSLVEVRFKTETMKCSIYFASAVLSAESIQSIIDGLATVTTAQTLTLSSAITLTDEQKATINAKGWTLAQ